MILTRYPCLDKNRYNIAACNEVAVVFVSDDGDPPTERDVCIYEKTSDKPIHMGNCNVKPDSLTYFCAK